ncbi:restriction endonuclease subunit S [Flavobacterium sp. WC2509]|uniref:restriction endonuclease subunit S n=1 Tax=Flavobacterium sp. WC2509 TaxID=3461406 RepID=UPI0040447BE2
MPNNWKSYKLSQVTTKIGSGSTPRGGQEAYKTSGISLIRSQNVLDFTFSTNGLAFIDDAQASKLNNVTLEEEDVLFNITGDSVARVCQVPKELLPARVNQHVAIIRANKEILNPSFLKYSLLETSNKNSLLNLASAGATRQAITKSMIEEFEIKLPSIQEQQSIASILSVIDDKIENNLAINNTLEEMAMTLYKHWFVDFGPFQDDEFAESELGMIPKGWEVKPFLELFQLLSGGTPKTTVENYWNGNIYWVSAKDIGSNNGGSYINDTEKKITQLGVEKSATKILPEDTVIVVARGSVGKFGIIAKPMAINQSCYGIYSKSNYSQALTYLLIQSLMTHFMNVSYGSVFDTITTSTFKNIKVIVPSKEIFEEIKKEVDMNFEKIKANIKENQTLTQLRDTLLPRLISGEVRLKEFREQIENVL